VTEIHNKLHKKLSAGDIAFGLFSFVPSPGLMELFAIYGLDFVVIDQEHGPPSFTECEHMIRAADVFGLTTIIRLPYQDFELVPRYLDTGAQGILAPHIATIADAQAFVDAAKFPPVGKRSIDGVLLCRAARTMPVGTVEERMQRANEKVMTIALIEDVEALDNLDGILAVEGLDTILVGPTDLSASMGHSGDWNHPEVQQAVEKIQTATIKARKTLLVPLAGRASGAAVDAAAARGARMIAATDYGMVEAGISEFLGR